MYFLVWGFKLHTDLKRGTVSTSFCLIQFTTDGPFNKNLEIFITTTVTQFIFLTIYCRTSDTKRCYFQISYTLGIKFILSFINLKVFLFNLVRLILLGERVQKFSFEYKLFPTVVGENISRRLALEGGGGNEG